MRIRNQDGMFPKCDWVTGCNPQGQGRLLSHGGTSHLDFPLRYVRQEYLLTAQLDPADKPREDVLIWSLGTTWFRAAGRRVGLEPRDDEALDKPGRRSS